MLNVYGAREGVMYLGGGVHTMVMSKLQPTSLNHMPFHMRSNIIAS